MQSNQGGQPGPPAGQSGEERRAAARTARRMWAEEVTQALGERRLSIHAAAKAVGISPGRLQAWLSQDVEPSPRVMQDLARVIGRSHIHLLQLLEWLPPELGDVPLRLEATQKLREAMAEARRWVYGATSAVGLHGGSLVAGALLEVSEDWQVAQRATTRGDRYPVRHSMSVAANRITETSQSWATGAADTAKDRAEIEQLVYHTLVRTSATWRDPEAVEREGWAIRPDLTLSVPVLCASRPRGLRPNLAVPPSIAVVGVPFSGSQEVAALLAGALDWAYFEVVALAREQFGVSAETPAVVTDRAQAGIAERLLEDPEGTGRLTVWSYSDPKPILETFRTLHDDLPLVILLRAPDSLLDRISAAASQQPTVDADMIDAAQNVARRKVTTRDPATYLILDLPDLPVDPGRADQAFDAHVELAFAAATWLHDNHGGPPLAQGTGALADLWRMHS